MKEHLKRYIAEGASPQTRGLRVLLEYFYAMEQFRHLARERIPVVSVFGSARALPDSETYKQGYEMGRLLYREKYAVITGGSTGVMEAANQGVADEIANDICRQHKLPSLEEARASQEYKDLLKRYSLGLHISLQFEESENPWVGTGATFHYFMVRKFFFASLSHAFIACEGGWGTRDELYEMLTLVQTGKAPLMPIIFLSNDPTHLKNDLMHTIKEKYIDREDLNIIDFVDQPADAIEIIKNFYKHFHRVDYLRRKIIRLYLRKKPGSAMRHFLHDIWPKYQNGLKNYQLRQKTLDIVKRPGFSYGIVRRFINELSEGI